MTDDDVLYGDDPEYPYDDEPQAPPDAEQANRMLRRWIAGQAEIARLKTLFADEIARLTRRRNTLLEPLQQQADWLEAALAAWHRAVYQDDPKHRKTMHLPHGSMKSTRGRIVLDIDNADMGTLVAWAKEHAPTAIVTDDPYVLVSTLAPCLRLLEADDHDPLADTLVIALAADGSDAAPPLGVTATRRARTFKPKPPKETEDDYDD